MMQIFKKNEQLLALYDRYVEAHYIIVSLFLFENVYNKKSTKVYSLGLCDLE